MLRPLRDDDTRKRAFIASRAIELVQTNVPPIHTDVVYGMTTLGASSRNLAHVVVPRSASSVTVGRLGSLGLFGTDILPTEFLGGEFEPEQTVLSASTRCTPEGVSAQSSLFVTSYVWGGDNQPSRTVCDSVIIELEKLELGWAGAASVPPSQEIIEQIGSVLDYVPANSSVPHIEVEEENGSVSLRWMLADRSRSFSLVFRGNGRVTGVLATVDPPRSRTWTALVNDEARIASAFEDHNVREVIAS